MSGTPQKQDIKQVRIALKGAAVLNDPRWNKGSAFTREERERLDLRGRLPFAVDTLEQQVERAYTQYKSRESDILKNSFLQSMKSQNWTLFYALLERHTTEMYPVIYTPTEADAIANYSHLFRRSEGLYLSPPEMDGMEAEFLDACEGRDLDLIVVSDGEAILGIGDQGSGGIGISSAKAVIYTLAAGIDPAKALAVVLDVGTNNEDLLKDELYIGLREKRLRGEAYDQFVDKFVGLVRKHQSRCLLHFEDFGVTNAQRLLARFRKQHAVFNDDIQGTGAVTAAISVTKSKIEDQRIVVYGSGSAGLGIARQLRDAMRLSTDLSEEEAASRFWLLDKHGLIKKSLGDKIRDEIEQSFIRQEGEWGNNEAGLLEVIKKVKPTVLIGTSTHAKAFTEEVVREMAKHVDRPIIFPLSNPTRLCEVEPKDANQWTNGKALIATGSPFPPVDTPGTEKKYVIAECNNALIYPGLGLGTILSRAKTMTDKMIVAGAKRLAELAPALKDPDQALLPDFGDAAKVNLEVGLAVLEQAIEEGVATEKGLPKSMEERRKWADQKRWAPEYVEYVYDTEGER
ncbi:NAD-dependent malic enzyme, mitochondrial [Saitozyma podzolica]|uniref:NAD-dependent malic enzyme, mitochondrial n=1 Tax=Saitozyma podzolica TaxID=1890683 RepID=A0A427YLG9_9TREE|nr:NAD-dependent malic enzyme, mitochondrial [Saitozyma podzolica]